MIVIFIKLQTFSAVVVSHADKSILLTLSQLDSEVNKLSLLCACYLVYI